MSEPFKISDRQFLLIPKTKSTKERCLSIQGKPGDYESLWRERVFNDVCLISDLEQAEEA